MKKGKKKKKMDEWISSEDAYLAPFDGVIRARHARAASLAARIAASESSLAEFSRGYKRFGVLRLPDGRVGVREWLPAARAVFVFGDFNDWRRHEFPLARDEFGVWHTALPAGLVRHGHFVKLGVVSAT